MTKVASLSVQKWGNSLAVRIPSAIANAVKLTVGQPVGLSVEAGAIIIKPVGEPKLSLTQKLAAFEPKIHLVPEVLR